MAFLVAALLIVVPLIITPGLLFSFDVTPKVVVSLLAASAALSWLAFRPIPSVDGPSRWLLVLGGAQILSLAISTAFSTDPALSLWGSNWRRLGFVTHAAILCLAGVILLWLRTDPRRVIVPLRAMLAGGLLLAVYVIAQYFGWDPWLPMNAYHIGEGRWTIVRPPGTLGHASYASVCLLYAVFAGVALASLQRASLDTSRAWRTLAILGGWLAASAIVLSGTRSAILGGLAGGAVLLFFEKKRNLRRLIAAGAFAIFAFAAFYSSPAGLKLRGRTRWYVEDARGGPRLLMWRDSLRMASQRPAAGWGPETFIREFPKFQSRDLARAFPDFFHESPHNVFLDFLTAQGFPGLLVFAAICAAGFAAAGAARATVPNAGLAAGLVAVLVSQQFSVFTAPTALLFYVWLAILVVPPSSTPASNLVMLSPMWRIGALAAAAVCGVSAIRMTVADLWLARTQEAIARGSLSTAAHAFDRVRWWHVPGTGADLWFSRAIAGATSRGSRTYFDSARAVDTAFAAAERGCHSAEDRHNAFYNLAAFCALRNDFPCVERSLRSSIAAAPNWFKPHWTLAEALRLRGRIDEAEAEAAQAADLDGGKHPEVAQTLSSIRASRAQGNKK